MPVKIAKQGDSSSLKHFVVQQNSTNPSLIFSQVLKTFPDKSFKTVLSYVYDKTVYFYSV